MCLKCVLLALGALLATVGVQAREIGVMTFNIRYGTADDGENSWPHRKALVAETIRQQAPDVLGLQECLRFQAEELDAMLPEYRWFGTGRDADGEGEMCAIFYRKDSFVPMAWETFWLSEEPDVPGSVSWDSSLTRIASSMRLRHIESGKTVHVYNTHFDHRGETARRRSAELLAKRTAALPGEATVVVMGDFNAVAEDSAPWRELTGAGFRDAWLEADERNGPRTTWCAFKTPDPDSTSRIDWILVRGPVTVARCETVDHHEGERYPSDHLPVFARILLGDEPRASSIALE